MDELPIASFVPVLRDSSEDAEVSVLCSRMLSGEGEFDCADQADDSAECGQGDTEIEMHHLVDTEPSEGGTIKLRELTKEDFDENAWVAEDDVHNRRPLNLAKVREARNEEERVALAAGRSAQLMLERFGEHLHAGLGHVVGGIARRG